MGRARISWMLTVHLTLAPRPAAVAACRSLPSAEMTRRASFLKELEKSFKERVTTAVCDAKDLEQVAVVRTLCEGLRQRGEGFGGGLQERVARR